MHYMVSHLVKINTPRCGQQRARGILTGLNNTIVLKTANKWNSVTADYLTVETVYYLN